MQFKDQLHRIIELERAPKRILSLVPSQTELLFDLGLEEEVVGITKFCVHPKEWFRNKTRVGGTKKLDLEKIRALRPDLIIANKEENDPDQINTLMQEFPVWVSDIKNLDDALFMMEELGRVLDKENKAQEICDAIRSEFKGLSNRVLESKSAVYFIWRDPWMCAGNDTFINDLMARSGFTNAIKEARYPILDSHELIQLNPEILLLSSEPFPFKDKHLEELRSILPRSKCLLVDGEMFSWYGSRLKKSPSYFRALRNMC